MTSITVPLTDEFPERVVNTAEAFERIDAIQNHLTKENEARQEINRALEEIRQCLKQVVKENAELKHYFEGIKR